MHLTVVALAVLMALDREAAAEETPARKGYALEIVVMDVGTILGGAILGSPELAALGYAIGSPIVHWAHRDTVGGFMSLALHVVAPIVGGFAARAADGEKEIGVWGVAGGVLLATTLDAAALARPAPQHSITVIAGRF